MFIRLRKAFAAGLAAAFLVGLLSPPGVATAQPEEDILEQLKRIPGLTVHSEGVPPSPEYRFFVLSYAQPSDHRMPLGQTFRQRLTLLHKSTDRPTVSHTDGRWVRTSAFRAEPTRMIDGNQISIEQRFFEPSRPNPANWDHLRIWQAASDHHRLVTAFKPIYQKKWIATGTGKGGMASVYHNRFYPQDVDGVVAYGATNDTNDDDDQAYTRFLETVGTDPGCRTRLANLQVEAFERRPAMLTRFEQHAAKYGYTYDRVGPKEMVLEYAIWISMWAFWQIWGESYCPTVPVAAALSDDALFEQINRFAPFELLSDVAIVPQLPDFFLGMIEQSWASPDPAHLHGYLKYPEIRAVATVVPPELRRPHRPEVMRDIDRWVRTDSQRILFVDGEYDGWTAKPFTPSANDSHRYVVPKGIPSTTGIGTLAGNDRNAATSTVRRWADIGVVEELPVTELDRNGPREVSLF